MLPLKMILDKFREYNLHTYHMFIIFKAAYDSVKINGFPAKSIRPIRATLDCPISSVRNVNEVSNKKTLFIFKNALKGAIRSPGVQRNGTIITRQHMLPDFADNIDLIGIDHRSVVKVSVALYREATRIGLTIKPNKMKYTAHTVTIISHSVSHAIQMEMTHNCG